VVINKITINLRSKEFNSFNVERFIRYVKHQGNDQDAIGGRKIAIDNTGGPEMDLFESEVLSSTDYYPFGLPTYRSDAKHDEGRVMQDFKVPFC